MSSIKYRPDQWLKPIRFYLLSQMYTLVRTHPADFLWKCFSESLATVLNGDPLVAGFRAEAALADKVYSTDNFIKFFREQMILVVIPRKKIK